MKKLFRFFCKSRGLSDSTVHHGGDHQSYNQQQPHAPSFMAPPPTSQALVPAGYPTGTGGYDYNNYPPVVQPPTAKAVIIERCGPYGRQQEDATFDFILEKGDEITKVHIESGFIVDELAFEVVDQSGNVKTIWSDGRVTGKEKFQNGKVVYHESHTINLAGERITQISGFVGDHENIGRHVAQLFIHTDVVKEGYGPFGLNRNCTNITSFKSPHPSSIAPVVGFFGTKGKYMHSIGIYLQKGK